MEGIEIAIVIVTWIGCFLVGLAIGNILARDIIVGYERWLYRHHSGRGRTYYREGGKITWRE